MKRLLLLLICFSALSFYKGKPQRTIDLKIMSYNIRHGKGLDTVLDLSRAAELIKNQAPDLCGLQEIDQLTTRSDNVNQTQYLAEHTQMEGTFGKFMSFQNGEYGMATLSAKPITSTKILKLPDGLQEPRAAIVHEVDIAIDCTIIFANVHFDWIESSEGSASRLQQAKTLVAYINSLDKAAIITGDFNCTPDSPTMQYFADQGFVFVEKGADHLSFQGEDASEIDHLIYRNSEQVKFKTKQSQLLKAPIISDHRPLVVTLEVRY